MYIELPLLLILNESIFKGNIAEIGGALSFLAGGTTFYSLDKTNNLNYYVDNLYIVNNLFTNN